jgi:hypothetical protein
MELATKMQLATKSFTENVALMEDKTTKALAALSGIKTVNSKEEDEKAAHILSRVRPTFTAIQEMRKQITDPMDQIKSTLMEFEKKISTAKGSKSDYTRVKLLRDAYANQVAANARAEQERIQREKDIKTEEANIKSKLVESIELGVFDLIKDGEIQLTKFVAGMTLENFDAKMAMLNYTPKIKPEAYEAMMQVQYNKDLISVQAYSELLERLEEKFGYDHVNSVYSKTAIEALAKFKHDIIPARKEELTKRSEASQGVQKIKANQEAAMLDDRIKEIEKAHEAEKEAVIERVEDQAAEEKINAEFDTQVELQEIEIQKGIRKNISYSIDESISPSEQVNLLAKVITHIMVDPKFKGIIKRDKQGFPVKDSEGNTKYVDGVNYWLKELAKLKIDVNIDNLIKTENVSTIVKAS